MSESNHTVDTKFLVVSDTHDLLLSEDTKRPFRNPTPKVDVVLHCGDMTTNGALEQYERCISLLANMNAELKLVIAGNHDLSLDQTFYVRNGGNEDDHTRAVSLWNDDLTKNANIRLLQEGTHDFTLKNGATFTVYASSYTPQYGISAFQYPTNEDRYNLTEHLVTPAWAKNVATQASAIPSFPKVDIIMTHGPPKYVLDRTRDGDSGGCEHLRRAVQRAKPYLHCFGHIHHARGAQKIDYRMAAKRRATANSRRSGERQKRSNSNDADYDLAQEYESEKENREYVEECQSTSVNGEEEDPMQPLPIEYPGGPNQQRRKGYAQIRTQDIEHGKRTLFVNAAIMDDESEPTHAPWLIEMALPLSSRG